MNKLPLSKILLVDDDEDDRFLFSDALREINETLVCDEEINGIEALQHLQDKSPLPDIIFLDLNMPKMNGLEFLSSLRKQKRFDEIPVVIFTTSTIQAEKDRLLKMGASYFLSKPCEYNTLKSELESILDKIQDGN